MRKVKEIFQKILASIRKGLRVASTKIDEVFEKLGIKSFFKKLTDYILYLPRKLTQNWTYRKKQAAWGVVFTSLLVIGLIYFFIIPFFITIIYSFSRVENLSTISSTQEHIGL